MGITHKKHSFSSVIVIVLSLCSVLFFAACGNTEPAKALDLQALYDQLQQETDTPEMFLLSPERVNKLYGIEASTCPQAFFATCSEGLRIDEIWLVEAGTEDAAKEIETLAQGRVDQLMRETENYLPDQFVIAKQAKILRNGKTVALFISPDAEKMAALFKAA